MDKKTPIASLPFDGLMLWRVHFQSSYYETDPRWPGTTRVDKLFFVLAKNRSEARGKVDLQLKKLRREYQESRDGTRVVTEVVALKNLIAARDSYEGLSEIKLSLKKDRKLYRLGVCLIPVEQ